MRASSVVCHPGTDKPLNRQLQPRQTPLSPQRIQVVDNAVMQAQGVLEMVKQMQENKQVTPTRSPTRLAGQGPVSIPARPAWNEDFIDDRPLDHDDAAEEEEREGLHRLGVKLAKGVAEDDEPDTSAELVLLPDGNSHFR